MVDKDYVQFPWKREPIASINGEPCIVKSIEVTDEDIALFDKEFAERAWQEYKNGDYRILKIEEPKGE